MYKTYSKDGTIKYYGTNDGTASGTTNYNMKVVEFFLDSSNWESFKDLQSQYADYVIGAPTLELYHRAYEAYGNTNPVPDVTLPPNYQLIPEMPTPNANGYPVIFDGQRTSYMPMPWSNNGSQYYAACPESGNNMYYIIGNGNMANASNIQYPKYGFRPVVCLKEGCILLEDDQNPGQYIISTTGNN